MSTTENTVTLSTNDDLKRFKGKRLTFLPELDAYGGYGIHASHYVREWDKLGVHVSVRPIKIKETDEAKVPAFIKRCFVHRDQPEPWEVVLSPASFCPLGRRKTLYFTMYEASNWSPKMVKLINKAEAAIVPCEWNRQGLIASGAEIPIYKVPLGFSPDIFKPTPMRMDGPCVFGAAGRLSHGAARKGLNAVIDAFMEEFPTEKDVQLHIKGFRDTPTKFVTDRRVRVREGFISDAELSRWFGGLTCFVSAARGEAWGLMQMEAMAVGRPVISAIYGGLGEFMRVENSFSVDYDLELAGEAWAHGGYWADPNPKHIRDLMRKVYNDREIARSRGLIAAADVKEFTWKNSAIKTLEVMEELGALV
jgi:glycosyltransferase involved in cell wall biosynthesis